MFLQIAMLVLGGMYSVTGALVGVVIVTVLSEVLRWLGDGPQIGSVQLPMIVGLSSMAYGAIIVIFMIWRPGGVAGQSERSTTYGSGGSAGGPRPAPLDRATLPETVAVETAPAPRGNHGIPRRTEPRTHCSSVDERRHVTSPACAPWTSLHRGLPRRDPWSDRPQRRRQDHPAQHDLRALHGHFRGDHRSRAE